jgi:hypothetical protein
MGILASSPELMSSAQRAVMRGQPVKAKQGASVNMNYFDAIPRLAAQGDIATLTNIYQDTRLPTDVRNFASKTIGTLTTPRAPSQKPRGTGRIDTSAMAGLPNLGGRAAVPNMRSTDARGTGITASTPILGPLLTDLGNNQAYFDKLSKPGPEASNLERAGDMVGRAGLYGIRAIPNLIAGIANTGAGIEEFLTREDPYGEVMTANAEAQAAKIDDYEAEIARRLALKNAPEDAIAAGEMYPAEVLAAQTTPMNTGDAVEDDAVDVAEQPKASTEAAEEPNVITPKPIPEDAIAAGEMLASEPTTEARQSAGGKVSDVIQGLVDQVSEGLTPEEAATPEAAAALVMKTPARASLSEMQKQAKEILGYDPSSSEKSKQDSFWRNLTMAGLAIAAGESENALTNVAKGLMIGVDQFGKDVKEINAADREARKEYAQLTRDLVRTEEDRNIALANLENNWNLKTREMKNKQDKDRADRAFLNQKLVIDSVYKVGQLALQEQQIDISQGVLDENIRKNMIAELQKEYKEQPEIMKLLMADGKAKRNKDGTYTFTKEGQALFDQALETAVTAKPTDKSTDLTRASAALDRMLSGNPMAGDQGLVLGKYGPQIDIAGGLPQFLAEQRVIAGQQPKTTESGFSITPQATDTSSAS